MKKKFLLVAILASVIFGGVFPSLTSASSTEKTDQEIMQEQIDGFEQIEKEIQENRSEVIKQDKGLSTSSVKTGLSTSSVTATGGTYPTRKGVILVTPLSSTGTLVGHAGIIYSSTRTVESFTGDGVQYHNNTWNSRYIKVYAATTSGTSITQDANAANRASSHTGKSYNWDFLATETTTNFYCSQLVYEAYKYVAGLNLNQAGGIVSPMDLIQSEKTYTIYTKGI
ncbi:YiiX/YebB-like N1pC/P60 family cysteine hydrolase [Bacillus sp. DJP31]|uniref:YiiX/YebB-like N1pC/P60 family cysteine hydrolase n=1 Tax=Bacillus sp. DJP31 TaxID=3409789 RepID=UPI003BB7ED7B